MNGWILLHKKIWLSPNFKCKNKSKMFLVWIWLLTYCDENGKVTAGRDQIAREIGISSSSVQRAIDNLKLKMTSEVNIKPNNIFTEFYICNWKKYQRKENRQPNTKRTATEQQVNTNKELKNKEYDRRTLTLAEYLKTNPTFSMEKYTTDIYADFSLKEPTNAMIAWCTEKKLEPNFRRWINWMRRAKKANELEVRK